ncbi:hypothetical protein FOCC_FOCC006031 [Frankliniella occidentalis]|nr:hypothetical protein FOCC_FOCC006031 [Frankliniella occidentalis]
MVFQFLTAIKSAVFFLYPLTTSDMDVDLVSKSDAKSSRKKAKKEKKLKKHKKEKKQKKHKKKIRESSSSSSSDSEESGNEWVEKESKPKFDSKVETEATPLSSAPQRDEWMNTPSIFACVTRDQLRAAKEPSEKQKKEEEKKYMLDRPGQTDRELNPYWKINGTGLPSEKPVDPESLTLNANTVGDQGVSWLRRALKRAKEQAEESGRSLEEVATERWGSLEKLEELLSEAEGRKVSLRQPKFGAQRRDNRTENRYDKGTSNQGTGFNKLGEGSNERRNESGRRYREEKERSDEKNYTRRHETAKDEDRGNHSRKPNFARPSDSHSSSYSNSKRESSSTNRSYDDSESFDRYRHSTSDGRSKLSFRKPVENDIESSSDYRSSQRSSGSSRKSWRKKEAPSSETSSSLDDDNKNSCCDASTSKISITKNKNRNERAPSRSSSPEAEDNSPPIATEPAPEVLSDKQMNELAAKLVKAEILGNEELVAQLKKRLSTAREIRAANPEAVTSLKSSNKTEAEVVILTRTDSKGFARPLQTYSGAHPEPVGGRRKREKADTHGADGQRVRYFPDDDKYSLQDMFQKEKLTTAQDQNEMFANLAGKDKRQEHDLDMDDIFSEKARQKESDGKIEARERGRAISEHKRKERMLDDCKWCFDGKELKRHLIVAVGAKSYICLPPYQSLTEGHCLIIPLHHSICATQLDEDVWEEMQDFRKALVRMFAAEDEDCVLFESAMYLNKFPHMVMHCVPLPREVGDMAPIYFKKAILESETEWSTNKKLVDLAKKDVRHSVPKGLPYFAVDFGNEGGFAHVIEDEKDFPTNFAQEIIGGMLDLDHTIWRKPRFENFDKQRRKVLDFSKKWEDFDFTKKNNPSKRMKTDSTSDESS